MSYGVTFTVDETTVTLQSPEIFEKDAGVITNVTVLLSGKRSVQASAETGLNLTFKCYTTTYTNISSLRALIGSAGTLNIDGTDYTNCYISKFCEIEWHPGKWDYTVSFVRDTTT